MTTAWQTGYPYVGLRPYTTDERHLFFGRDPETELLFDRVYSTPLSLVYAPSGVGKSSLLQAGLRPQLEAGVFEVATLDTWEPRPAVQLEELIRRRFPVEQRSAWWCDDLHTYAKATRRCPVLVLDQFEEVFRYGDELDVVWDQLAAFARRTGRSARMVIGVREDYLAGLDRLLRRVPTLIENGLHLGRMSREAMRQAFERPLAALTPPFTADDGLFERLMSDLRSPYRGRPEVDAEPGHFQVVCRRLFDLDRSNPDRTLTLASYRRAGGAAEILSERLRARLEKALPEPDQRMVLYAVVRYLVTPSGAKIPLTVDDVVSLVRPQDFTAQGRAELALDNDEDGSPLAQGWLRELTEETLNALCGGEALILRRVMRGEESTYELFHDLLGRVLLAWREDMRAEQERDLARQAEPVLELRQQGRTRLDEAGEGLQAEDEREWHRAVRGIGEVMVTSNVLDDSDLYGEARRRLEDVRGDSAHPRPLRFDAARTLERYDRLFAERRLPSGRRAVLAGLCYWLISAVTTGLIGLAARAVMLTTSSLTVPWPSYLIVLGSVALLWAGMYVAEGFNDYLYSRPGPWYEALGAPFEPYRQGIDLFERSSGWPFNFVISIVPAAVLAPLCTLAALSFLFWFALFVALFSLIALTAFNFAVVMV
ncbi:hypothetical protein [Kitasatospora cinereorecta]|uniref:Novel STAND NTPase 1 domain-containing protein n=1 Tax=Kitasatospora cinereorecta TaxID=285560 RepID=A0ABW0V917_9ACTN